MLHLKAVRQYIFVGLPYMVGAAFAFSLMSLFVKMAGQRLPSQQIVLVRWANLSLWGKTGRCLS